MRRSQPSSALRADSRSPSRSSISAFAIAASITLASCGAGSLESMERSADDPMVVAPTVLSFAAQRSISISWPTDPCADEYVLESASGSAASPAYSVVYRGTDTSYQEEGCVDQSLHLFRLSKLRGDREFGPSAPVLGVGSVTCEDLWEPNDTADTATDLGYEKDANLYYYRSYGGLEVQDLDWYSLKVPPRMVAYVLVTQTSPVLANLEATGMNYAMPGQLSASIKNGALIALTNYAYTERTIAFEIFPNAAYFIGAGGTDGGSLIDYTVRLEQINSL